MAFAAGVQAVRKSEQNHNQWYRHQQERRNKKHNRKLKFGDFYEKALGVRRNEKV